MEENHKFYQNKKCDYFSCHDGVPEEKFNCNFCFCPLHHLEDCGGNYTMLPNGIKDCSKCTIPHQGVKGYDYIVNKLYGDNDD